MPPIFKRLSKNFLHKRNGIGKTPRYSWRGLLRHYHGRMIVEPKGAGPVFKSRLSFPKMKKILFIIIFTALVLLIAMSCTKQTGDIKCGKVYCVREVWTDSAVGKSFAPGHMVSRDTTDIAVLCGAQLDSMAAKIPSWHRICATNESPAFWDHTYEIVN